MSNSVRIGVDMAATAGQKSGLGFYVQNMVESIKKQSGEHEIIEISTIQKNLRTPQRILWDSIGLPATAMKKGIDLLYIPAFSAPRFRKPIVMTAHDIFGIIHPDHFAGPAKYYWSHILPKSMKRADHLICISDYTKQSILSNLDISESRMTVIHPAASDVFHVMDDMDKVKKNIDELGVRTPFILSVGTLEPRKNFSKLIEAFVFAQRQDVKLVLVGKKGWNYENIYDTIRKYQLQESILILDYVNQEQLVSLYNACLFFVMPSIFEGFGLPALEAMKCGAPVAVAQNSSLPEVVGTAGVLFDPHDVDSIRERLDLLLTDSEFRSELQEKSLKQAKKFSWDTSAAAALKIFHSVLS